MSESEKSNTPAQELEKVKILRVPFPNPVELLGKDQKLRAAIREKEDEIEALLRTKRKELNKELGLDELSSQFRDTYDEIKAAFNEGFKTIQKDAYEGKFG